MLVLGDQITGPHRSRSATMGNALEAGTQRLLDHLRRPIPGRRDLLTNNAGNTVNEIVPSPKNASFVALRARANRCSGDDGCAVACFPLDELDGQQERDGEVHVGFSVDGCAVG